MRAPVKGVDTNCIAESSGDLQQKINETLLRIVLGSLKYNLHGP